MKPVYLVFMMVAVAIVFFGSLLVYNNTRDTKPQVPDDAAGRVVVEFSGGRETQPEDNGHPVTLIANALDITPQVFREAFFQFVPDAENTDTDGWKQHLPEMMKILGPHGVTEARLTEVLDYYAGTRAGGATWPLEPAIAWATVKDGKITGFEVTTGGAGYNSPPTVNVAGHDTSGVKAELSGSNSLKQNGAVSGIQLGPGG